MHLLSGILLTLTGAFRLRNGQEEEKTRPLAKVIKLLKDMSTQLQAEQEDDQKVYKKLSCWCTKNDEEKAGSIKEAESAIQALEATIKEYAASIAELRVKIIKVKDEYNKDWDALKNATELRMKEADKFSQEEKDMLETIDACKQAVIVLSKHHPDMMQLRDTSKALKKVRNVMLKAALTTDDKNALQQFLNQAANPKNNISFLAIPGFQSYSSQSGQVFGILKQMGADFQANLTDAQKEEQVARTSFVELKAAKEEQMAASRKQQANYEEELADSLEKKAQAEEDLFDTEESLSNDQKFLLNLRKRCTQTDEEYHARQKSRNEEISAVSETIDILNNDDAFEVAGRALPKQTEFIQLSVTNRKKMEQALAVLVKLSKTDPRIGMLAMKVRLDAFTKVKKAIDGMITQLKEEKKDEIKHRDFCINEFNKNEREQNAKADERDDLQTKADTLKGEIETLTNEIDTLNSEVKEMHVQMKHAAENREGENAEFQASVKDQRITQEILNKAKVRMAQKYYFVQIKDEPQVGGAHTQTSATKTDPGNGPARFAKYKHKKEGGMVITLLDRIIADSEHLESEMVHDEQQSQTAYEEFVWDSNKTIEAKNKEIVNKTENRAQSSEHLTITKGDHSQAMKALELLNNHKGNLHKSCDFVLNNFEVRQDARDQEMTALREAQDILSGMK